MFMFIHFCLTDGFINSNKQKEIPHRAGSKWTLTERDWTGPLREDIVEWIAARDGALA